MALNEDEMSANSNRSLLEYDITDDPNETLVAIAGIVLIDFDASDAPNETIIAIAGIVCAFLMLALVFLVIVVLGAYCTQPLSPQQLYIMQQKREARRRPYRHCRHSHRRPTAQRFATPYATPLSSRRMEQGQARSGRREEEAETAV